VSLVFEVETKGVQRIGVVFDDEILAMDVTLSKQSSYIWEGVSRHIPKGPA
jgi:hypothetical protein